MRSVFLCFFLLGGLFSQLAMGTTVTMVNANGHHQTLEIESQDHFLDVINCIQSYFLQDGSENEQAEASPVELSLIVSKSEMTVRAKKPWRDYEAGFTKEDKKDIAFILNTLARESLLNIGLSTSSINKAGDRLDYLHPFCFLICIFTDEELKCSAHAIRDRGGMVSEGFFGGITRTLEEESHRNNVFPFVSDFAKKLKLDVNLIMPVLKNGQWREFAEILIDKVPRKNNPSRYDM